MEGKIVLAGISAFFFAIQMGYAAPAHKATTPSPHPSSEACVNYPIGGDTTQKINDPEGTNVSLSPDLSGYLTTSRRPNTGSKEYPVVFKDATGADRWLRSFPSSVYSTKYSPDGTRVAIAFSDKTAMVLDTLTGDVLLNMAGFKHTPELSLVARNRLATYDLKAKTTQLWDIDQQAPVYTYDKLSDSTSSAPLYSGSGNVIVSAAGDTTTVSRRGMKTWTTKSDRYNTRLVVSPDGNYLLMRPDRNTVVLLDTATGKKLHTFTVTGADEIVFSPDSSRFAIRTASDKLQLYEINSKALLREINGSSAVHHPHFSSDGKKLIAYDSYNRKQAHLYSAETHCLPAPGPVSIAAALKHGVTSRLAEFCSGEFDENIWNAVNQSQGNSWNPTSAENYLYRFQKPESFDPASHSSVVDSLLASDAGTIRPDLVAGMLRTVLQTSSGLYEYFLNKYPSVVNRWYPPSPCQTESEQVSLANAAIAYLDTVQKKLSPGTVLKDWAMLRPLSPALALLTPAKKNEYIGSIARNMASGSENHKELKGVFNSQVNYLAREYIQGFFGEPPRPLTNLAVSRDSYEVAPVLLGTLPFQHGGKAATQTPLGFYAMRLPAIPIDKLSKSPQGIAQNVSWQHGDESYSAALRVVPIAKTGELITAKTSLPWEDHWRDRRLATLVTLGSQEGTKREETMNHYIHSIMTREYPKGERFEITPSEPVDDMPGMLQMLVESGAVDIISRESSAHGNQTDFTMIDPSGRIRRATRFLGNYNAKGERTEEADGQPFFEDVYFLLPPKERSKNGNVRIPASELGKWMPVRLANGGGALSVLDWSCGACARAPYLLEGAGTDKLVVLPTKSTAYEFRSNPDFPLNRLFQRLVERPSYVEMESIMHPGGVKGDSNRLLMPNMPEYEQNVTRQLRTPLRISLDIARNRQPYFFDDRVRELHGH
jgi:WD40 repeat protein